MHTFADIHGKTAGFTFPVGDSEQGELITADLLQISHLLIAGATGTGKSVFIHTLLLSLIQQNPPEKLRLVLCDTKITELCEYNGLNHMLVPVAISPKLIVGAIQWCALETQKRLRKISEADEKNLQRYNDNAWETFSDEMPRIVLVIDDFSVILRQFPDIADAMMNIITNGRTVGIHLIAITQTPTWKESKRISTLFRSKVLFSASTNTESRLLLGKSGAETLSACGEAMFSNNGSVPIKVHSIMVSQKETSEILSHEKSTNTPMRYDESVMHAIERNATSNKLWNEDTADLAIEETEPNVYDELLPAAIEVVVETGMASASILQRRLKLGYSRAARLLDQMEAKGFVGPFDGSHPRQVLITKEQWQDMRHQQGMDHEVGPWSAPLCNVLIKRKRRLSCAAVPLTLHINYQYIGKIKSGSTISAQIISKPAYHVVFTQNNLFGHPSKSFVFDISINSNHTTLDLEVYFDVFGNLKLHYE